MTPRATCRLQLHRDFPFDAAVEIVPYLARLGISHVYASPILSARSGRWRHSHASIPPGR
jgi:(1->4)-alpha-D-glucan 1-alpha-D-glucosylmutase